MEIYVSKKIKELLTEMIKFKAEDRINFSDLFNHPAITSVTRPD